MFQVFLMYALFGSIFAVGKLGLESAPPYFLTGVRMLIAGIVMLGYHRFKSRKAKVAPITHSKEVLRLLFLVGVFNVFVTNAFEFWGLQYMSAGKTSLIYSLSPFAAALLGTFFGTEIMNLKKWVGLCIGIFSFIPMMIGPWFESGSVAEDRLELLAEISLTVSALTAVLGWTFLRKLTVELKIPHLYVNGASFLIASFFALITSLAFETWFPLPIYDWTVFLASVLYIAVIHNIVCYSIYAESLKRFSVTFMAFAGLSNPIFAALFGWIFLKESVGESFWVALLGVLVGLFLFYRDEREGLLAN